MAIDIMKTVDIIELMENYLEKTRPPENMRHQIDIGYQIENQSVILFEARPFWNNPAQIMQEPYAKATYVKSKNAWKIYWMRSDSNWYGYEPHPEVSSLGEFLAIVDKDEYCCFKG